MKIVTSNRSDVFNEYVRIISKYNEKNLVKEATGWMSSARLVGEDAGLIAKKNLDELADLSSKAGERAALTEGRLAAAGIKSESHLKKIFADAKDLLENEKYLIRQSNTIPPSVRRATDAEKELIKKQLEKQGLSWGSEPKGPVAGFSLLDAEGRPLKIGVVTVSNPGKAVEYSKYLNDGVYFTEKEGVELRKLLGESLGAPPSAPGAARAAGEGGEGAATGGTRAGDSAFPSDYVRQTDIDVVDARFQKEIKGVGQGISVNIAEVRSLKKSTQESIAALETNLKQAMKEGNTDVVEKITAQLNSNYSKLDDLIKEEVKALREATTAEIQSLKSQIEAIEASGKAGDDRVISELTTKISETEANLASQLSKYDATIQDINQKAAKIEASAAEAAKLNEQTAKALSETSQALAKQSEELSALRKQLEELKAKIGEAGSQASSAAAGAGAGAAAKAGFLHKAKGALIGAIKLAAAVGLGYLAYKWITGMGSGSGGAGGEGGDGGSGGGGGGSEDPRRAGTTGDEDDVLLGGGDDSGRGAGGRDGKLSAILDNPRSRRDLFERIERMNPEDAAALLERIRLKYGGAETIKLKNPVVVNGERITYVFPKRFSGGDYDSIRRDATIPYFTALYAGRLKNGNMLAGVIENEAGTSDAQRIANHAFGKIAAEALFSRTFFQNRGSRVGKGKGNRGYSELGIAESGERPMTREERKALKQRRLRNTIENEASDQEIDPMSAFASGQQEYFNNISKNSNISTNKTNSYEFAKKADKISNRYFKDAVEDLQDDEFMKAYYAGFSKLHNQKVKKQKPDYDKLYDLHDETGADLIHKAHPKAISVAEAIGNGGLVENESEKSKAMEDVAFRVPSGNYRARYAFIQNALKKKS